MYFDYAVAIPLEKGKIITKKKGNAVYVLYQHGQVYKPDKKYAIPQRTIIGKVNPDSPDTMYPNEHFQEFFPTVILPEELPEAYRSCALRIGSYAVIKKVLDDYEIPRMLMNNFYKESGLILDLVAYMIVDEENAGQYYPDFAFNHPLFSENMRIYSDSKVCRLLKSISKEQINAFLNEWNDNRDHKQRIYVSYDSTNKNCHAGDIDLIEYGKPKDDQGLPIFNLAIAYDKNNRVPLFYEEYPGSITDVSQFRYMVDKVEQYNYKNVGFILDRGYFSKENIQYMDDNKHPFVIMVKGQKELVSALVHEHRNTFETDRSCAIRAYRVYGKSVFSKLYEDDNCERQFHIYYNPSKQAAEREQFEQQLDKIKMYLDKHISENITVPNTYKKYFTLRYNKKDELLSYEEKADVIQSKLEHTRNTLPFATTRRMNYSLMKKRLMSSNQSSNCADISVLLSRVQLLLCHNRHSLFCCCTYSCRCKDGTGQGKCQCHRQQPLGRFVFHRKTTFFVFPAYRVVWFSPYTVIIYPVWGCSQRNSHG